MVKKYIPDQGDIIWLNFDPQIGHEQSSLRPAVVVSNIIIAQTSNLVMVCPISSTKREYPTYVNLDDLKETRDLILETSGKVLCEQVKAIDYTDNRRNVSFKEKMPKEIMREITDIIISIIEIN